MTQAPESVHEGPAQAKLPEVKMLLAGETFDLEVAVTQGDLLRGLMYRNNMPPKHGMLFPFYPPRSVTFWMKNTRIPLDMVFIRNKLVVHVIHSAPPCVKDPCPTFDSIVPVDMVVEFPGGTIEQYGIDMGDFIQFTSKSQPATEPIDVFPAMQTPAKPQ